MGIQSFSIATPTPIQTTPVQGTSIAQMVNAANGIQQYQQAQQLNPLQLKQAQMAIEQAQQINPLAVKEAEAKLETAQTGAQQSKQNYLVSGEDYSRKMINALPPIDDYVDKNGDVNQKALTRSLDIIRKSADAVGLPKHPSNLLGQLEDAVTKKDYDRYEELRNRVAKSSASPSEQFASKFPAVGFQNLGGTIQPVATGNPNIAETRPGIPVAGGLPVSPSPLSAGQRETLEEDATGNKVIVTRDTNGTVIGSRPVPSTTAQPGFQSVPPGGTRETFQGQAKGAINSYLGAIHAINDVDSPATHVPTQERIATTILQKLKNPNLDTGPIAQWLAGNTKGIILTSEQQELMKLLEQRIQGLAPRTDADAQSKKDAYGSFKLKKDALMDIVRSDLGNIHKDSLLKNGIINSAGQDASNPNLAGINNFQQKFSKSSQNPILSTYIGIIGKHKDKTTIDEEDKQALKKFISENKLYGEQIKSLENERKQLIDLSSGGQ